MSRRWYFLSVFTGYEHKIEKTIKALIEKKELSSDIVLDVKVPEAEEVVELKDNKKKIRKTIIMPGYVMIEMDLPEIGWKDTCAVLYKIQGLSGFTGNINRKDRPVPLTNEEAKSWLMKTGDIKGEKQVYVRQTFNVGEQVKITDGAFATFTGVIKEINLEKEKLSVEVQIFGRPTPVELNFSQAEKI